MSPAAEKVLRGAAIAWIAVGMGWYCYAFSRDFYSANRGQIERVLGVR